MKKFDFGFNIYVKLLVLISALVAFILACFTGDQEGPNLIYLICCFLLVGLSILLLTGIVIFVKNLFTKVGRKEINIWMAEQELERLKKKESKGPQWVGDPGGPDYLVSRLSNREKRRMKYLENYLLNKEAESENSE